VAARTHGTAGHTEQHIHADAPQFPGPNTMQWGHRSVCGGGGAASQASHLQRCVRAVRPRQNAQDGAGLPQDAITPGGGALLVSAGARGGAMR
jgi:hypothetical protein